MFDIVFPNKNEKEFITVAEKLSINGLCLAYTYVDKKTVTTIKESVAKLQESTHLKLHPIFTAQKNAIYKVNQLNEIAITETSENIRVIIESLNPSLIYNIEQNERKDFGKSRNSGIDKGAAMAAKEKGTIIVISLTNILESKDLQLLIGRIQQNLMLTHKYKIKLAIASCSTKPVQMRSPRDLQSFLLALGAHTNQAKTATSVISTLF